MQLNCLTPLFSWAKKSRHAAGGTYSHSQADGHEHVAEVFWGALPPHDARLLLTGAAAVGWCL